MIGADRSGIANLLESPDDFHHVDLAIVMPGFDKVLGCPTYIASVHKKNLIRQHLDSLEQILARRMERSYAVTNAIAGAWNQLHCFQKGCVGEHDSRLPKQLWHGRIVWVQR